MSELMSGGCLCGKVRFKALPHAKEMGVCHCSMCRRWSGGVFMMVGCSEVLIEGDEALGVYKSSSYSERVFCKECGANLFWRLQDESLTSVAAQAFDEPEVFKFANEIFMDEKPDNFSFAENTNRMTGAEAIAFYASKQDG